MKVAVTCIQLLRDLDQWRSAFEDAELDLVVPDIPGQHLEGDELVRAMTGCVGVVAGDDQFTREVLDQLPELRIISKWGIGIDGIDLDAARDHGVTVTNTPGMFNDEVADITMAYITMLARQLVAIDRSVRSGIWFKPAGASLRGRTLGIVGLGGIGRALAERALVAGMVVVGSDPMESSRAAAASLGVEIVDFSALLRKSDTIGITCPLTPETRHLFDAEAFAMVRRGVHLVNTGRGAVVQTEALIDALRDGAVESAALDVMEVEPLDPTSELAGFDQVIFGSHNASNTLQASARVHELAIRNLVQHLRP